MKITIINTEKSEKRYAREELDTFVSQLKDGTYCQQYIRDFKKDVCFAAEWVKTNGELKAKSFNPLVLLSLENLRDLATANEYKRFAIQQPYTLLCFLGHDGHLLHTRCQAHRAQCLGVGLHSPSRETAANCDTLSEVPRPLSRHLQARGLAHEHRALCHSLCHRPHQRDDATATAALYRVELPHDDSY